MAQETKWGLFRDASFDGLGNSMYRGALCYELSGKNFQLIMDDGHEYLTYFASGETLMWAKDGGSFRWESYDCLKVDETTYFVNFELSNTPYRYGITLILDTEQSLVTLIVANQGHHPVIKDMISTHFYFGAIKTEGCPLPKKRHGFTSDMMGKRIHWRYSPIFAITHVYYNPFYYRVSRVVTPELENRPEPTPEERARMDEWPADEPSTYVKIKDNIYVFSFVEESFTKQGKIGNNMLFAMDVDRLHDVGRSFGLTTLPDGTITTENYVTAAIGQWEASDGIIEGKPNVYLV